MKNTIKQQMSAEVWMMILKCRIHARRNTRTEYFLLMQQNDWNSPKLENN